MGDYDGLMEHLTTNDERRRLRRARRELAALNALLAARSSDLFTVRMVAPHDRPYPEEEPTT